MTTQSGETLTRLALISYVEGANGTPSTEKVENLLDDFATTVAAAELRSFAQLLESKARLEGFNPARRKAFAEIARLARDEADGLDGDLALPFGEVS